MAGAVTACVPARAGTILGVTRSDANPTYRRLEQYEPLLRLAVPALLILFLSPLRRSAWVQIRDGRKDTLFDAINDIDIIASLSAAKLGAAPAPADRAHAAALLERLAKDMPPSALTQRPQLLLVDRGRRRSWRSHPPLDDAPAQPRRPARRGAAADAVRRPRRRHDDQVSPAAARASRPCARCPHPPARSRVVQPMPHVLVGLVDAHHRPCLAARRDHRGAARHRHRLCDAGEPRARRRRGLREGARPDRFRPQPRTLRPVGLGYRPRTHLLVRFHVRASRLRAPGRVPLLRRSQHDDPSRGSGSLHAGRAARLRQHLARRLRVPHPQHHGRLGVAARPRRADERSRRRGEPPRRHRGRRDRAARARGEDRQGRRAPARRHRGDLRGLRAVGRQQPPRAVQFEVPEAARAARRCAVCRASPMRT